MLSTAGYWLVGITAAVAFCAVLLYRKGTETFDHWKNRGVPFVPAVPFLGSAPGMVLKTSARCEELRRLYDRLDGHPCGGLFVATTPVLMLRDPELVRKVLVEHFECFTDRFAARPDEHSPMATNIFQACGSQWRFLRSKMTPAFSPARLRTMVDTMRGCSEALCEQLGPGADRGSTVDAKELSKNFTLDVIGACVYGLQLNCIGDPDPVLKRMAEDTTSFSWRLAAASFFGAKVPTINFCGLRPEVVSYFWDLAKTAIRYRKEETRESNDFLNILIKLKERGYIESDENEDSSESRGCNLDEKEDAPLKVTDDVVAAQCLIFFVAGFETTSATIGFCLYELALNADVQRRLRTEVLRVLSRHDGELSYPALKEMDYLRKVVAETLRKHPPASTLVRTCTRACVLPGTRLQLQPGDVVLVPIPGLHHDERHFPRPERFDPERFSAERARLRHRYCYLPFGEGPRACIGSLLGSVQVKVAVAALVSRYEVQPCARTAVPLVLDPRQIARAAAGGVWLKVTRAPPRRPSEENTRH
ncbi:probable cytochrome P450 6a13 [Bacillus rossius redtenbacheri]|uniref:probable cytochrome P450 6a13 n=1 Tax=Bacillus rossius redtenbacheri TaxID=93214 RepID=UPI002FDD7E3D